MRTVQAAALAALLALLCGCPSETYTLTLVNSTQAPLVPYPVVTDPPPPHREADPAGTLAHGDSAAIDVDAFNPLYYGPESGLAVLVQMDLRPEDGELLVRVLEYQVPPDEVTDEAAQVTLIEENVFAVTGTTLELDVGRSADGFPVVFSQS